MPNGEAYKSQLNLRSREAHLDWYPLGHGFHLATWFRGRGPLHSILKWAPSSKGSHAPESDRQGLPQWNQLRHAATDPTVQANIAAEQNKINNKLSPFKYYRVISFGFGYRF